MLQREASRAQAVLIDACAPWLVRDGGLVA
jgi:hypothetical protein